MEEIIKEKVKEYLKSLDPLKKMVDDNMFTYNELMTSVEIAIQESIKVKDGDEVNRKMREVLELCKQKGILGVYTDIDNYYVEFKFRKLKPKCKECGREGE